MQYSSIVSWAVALCTELRRSQAKTLGHLVVGAMRCRRVSIAGIGRCLHSAALVKNSIKRVYRFLANERVEPPLACAGLLRLVAARAGGLLWVTVDWTDIGSYKVLAASVPLGGRSIPVLFAAYQKWEFYRSQNAFEEGFFRLLAALMPQGVEAVIVADRGFGRAELFRTLRQLGLSWVIRLPLKVWFRGEAYSGRLDELPIRPGTHTDLGLGAYRKMNPVQMRVVFWWKAHQKEAWLLGTDLDWSWRKVCAAYGLRMQVEELFRDQKGLRHGWGLRAVSLSSPARLERLLLVLALAYLLLVLIGLDCRRRFSEKHWAAGVSRRKHQASLFFIGRFMQSRQRFRLHSLLRLLASQLALLAKENWG